MAYTTKQILRDLDNNPIPQIWDSVLGDFVPYEGKVVVSGNELEYYGATISERPLATSVKVGSVFMAVNTQEFWQSNGSTWVVI